MPTGHQPGSPNVIITWSRPSRLYAADGVTLKALTHGVAANFYTFQTAPADGDRLQMFFYARGNETILDITTSSAADRGKWDLYINGVLDTAAYDDYAAALNVNVRHIILTNPIVAGYNLIELRVNGKNAASTNFYIGVLGASIE